MAIDCVAIEQAILHMANKSEHYKIEPDWLY